MPPRTPRLRTSGKRRKVTPENMQEKFAEGVGLGMPVSLACKYAGMSEATYYSWQANVEQGKATEGQIKFLEAAKNAEAKGAAVLLARIRKAAEDPRTWQAAAWILERRYPEQYARPTRSEVAVSGALDVGLSSEQYAKRAAEKLTALLEKQTSGNGRQGKASVLEKAEPRRG